MENLKKQLSRDYDIEPLKKRENPPYEDVYFLYITNNLSVDETGAVFGLSRCAMQYHISKYKIKKSTKLKGECNKRKMEEKYGVTSYSKLKECQEKIKQTSLKHWGTAHPLKSTEIRKKSEQTCLEKYGTKNASQSEIVKQRTRQTCQERYGVDAVTQSQVFKDKTKETCKERYGVEFYSQSEDFKQKTNATIMKNFGVPWAMMSEKVKEKNKQSCLKKWGTSNISTRHIPPDKLKLLNSKEEFFAYINTFEVKDIKEIGATLGVSYDGLKKKLQEFNLWDKIDHRVCYAENELKSIYPEFNKTRSIISPYEIDLYNDKYKLGIEYNGVYWHSEVFKDKSYHQQKSLKTLEQGAFLFHVFEHEWSDERKRPILISQINNLLGRNSLKLGARKCNLNEISADNCNKFLQENHLQGKDKSSIRLGLFYKNELVSVMTFCRPRFNKKYEWELSRFCNKLNTSVVGAASRLFKYFIKTYNPKSIISYSNFSKTKGTLYKILGFNNIGLSVPNYVWIKGRDALSRYQCQKHLLEKYKDLGNTEDEIMHNRGYLKCYDCGSYKWEWFNS